MIGGYQEDREEVLEELHDDKEESVTGEKGGSFLKLLTIV